MLDLDYRFVPLRPPGHSFFSSTDLPVFGIKNRSQVLSQNLMGFDRAKAMRNAERFVAQGKIRAAIDEYRSVVDNDPRDIATLNMLGDLHAKNADKKEAVSCYMLVAEHYNVQGF